MIYGPLQDGGFVISSCHLWLPGIYESKPAANYAFKFTDDQLEELRDKIVLKESRMITFKDLQDFRKNLFRKDIK